METSVNNKCKAFTSLEQSKKLAEILSLESADMWYHGHYSSWESERKYDNEPCPFHSTSPNWDKPCWSLAALLNVLPTLDDRNANFCKDIRYDKWHVYYHSTATLPIIDTDRYENLVDACFEMIIRLNKLNLL